MDRLELHVARECFPTSFSQVLKSVIRGNFHVFPHRAATRCKKLQSYFSDVALLCIGDWLKALVVWQFGCSLMQESLLVKVEAEL